MKVMIACILYENISPETMKSLAPMLAMPGLRWGDWTSDGLVSRGRSVLAARFLESDCDVLFHLDGDIGFHWRDAIEACEQAMTHDIVGGVYVGRRGPITNLPTTLFLPNQPVEFGKPGAASHEPVEVMFPAGGFLPMSRRAVQAVWDDPALPVCHAKVPSLNFKPIYQPFPWQDWTGEWLYLSEDWAVVQRAREKGFKAYVNPAIRLRHKGRKYFELEDAVANLPNELRGEPQRLVFTQLEDMRLRIQVGPDPDAPPAPEAVLPPGVSV